MKASELVKAIYPDAYAYRNPCFKDYIIAAYHHAPPRFISDSRPPARFISDWHINKHEAWLDAWQYVNNELLRKLSE